MFSQLFVQLGILNPSILSSFSFWLYLSLPILFLELVKSKAYNFIPGVLAFRCILIFLLIASSIVLFGYAQGVDDNVSLSFASVLLRAVPLFLFGFLFDYKSNRFRGLVFVFYLFYSLSVIIVSPTGKLIAEAIFYEGKVFELNYQQSACLYLFVSICLVASKSSSFRYLIYSISLVVLFLIGARSEFYAFPLVSLLSEVIHRRSFSALVTFLVFSIFVYLFCFNLFPQVFDNKIFAVILAASEASRDARYDLTADALRTIADNPILGGYNKYLPGNYSHNLLSVWVDFGLLGLFLFVFAFVIQVKYSLNSVVLSNLSCYLSVPNFLVLFSVIFLLFTAKSYSYSLIPICIGLHCKCKLEEYRSSRFKSLPDRTW